MIDVFIAYPHVDRPHVIKLAADLEREGYKVWWDDQLVAGTYYPEKIEEILDSARCAVVLWSEEARKSRFVYEEARRADGRNAYIGATVRGFPASRVPMPFGSVQLVDLTQYFRHEDAVAWNRLLAAIRQKVDEPSFLGASTSEIKKSNIDTRDEIDHWHAINAHPHQNKTDYEEHLEKWPSGIFSNQSSRRITEILKREKIQRIAKISSI